MDDFIEFVIGAALAVSLACVVVAVVIVTVIAVWAAATFIGAGGHWPSVLV